MEVPVPPTGKPGHPRLPEKVVHADLDYATVHKTRVDGHVVHVASQIIFGDPEHINEG